MMVSKGIKNSSELQIYPNPASTSISELTISGLDGVANDADATLEIQRITGEIIYAAKVGCGYDCADYSFMLSHDFPPGVYLVTVTTHGSKISKRLFIKSE